VPSVGSRVKAADRCLEAKTPEADGTFLIMLFCQGFNNDIAMFAFIAYKCSI